eukprot:172042_1
MSTEKKTDDSSQELPITLPRCTNAHIVCVLKTYLDGFRKQQDKSLVQKVLTLVQKHNLDGMNILFLTQLFGSIKLCFPLKTNFNKTRHTVAHINNDLPKIEQQIKLRQNRNEFNQLKKEKINARDDKIVELKKSLSEKYQEINNLKQEIDNFEKQFKKLMRSTEDNITHDKVLQELSRVKKTFQTNIKTDSTINKNKTVESIRNMVDTAKSTKAINETKSKLTFKYYSTYLSDKYPH